MTTTLPRSRLTAHGEARDAPYCSAIGCPAEPGRYVRCPICGRSDPRPRTKRYKDGTPYTLIPRHKRIGGSRMANGTAGEILALKARIVELETWIRTTSN